MNNRRKAPQSKPRCDAEDMKQRRNDTWNANVHGKQHDGRSDIGKSSNAHEICYMEKHEPKNGKLTKIKGFSVASVFVPIFMTKEEARGWVRQSGEIFPPQQMWTALRKYYGRYYMREVLELGGMGLFTTCDIKAGDLIGIYAGMKTASKGEYVMEIGETLLDGCPRGEDKLYLMGRLNDWYWGGPEQNCKVHEGGVITATRHIKKDEQLCMSYGPGYCWDGIKRNLIVQIPRLLKRVAEELEIYQYDEEIQMLSQRVNRLTREWRTEIAKDRLARLITEFVDGIPEECMHRYVPATTDEETFHNWMDRVLRSKGWNQRYAFHNWKPWEVEIWNWLHCRREQWKYKRPRSCQNKRNWIENEEAEELDPLDNEAALLTTGRWTTVEEVNEKEPGKQTEEDAPAPASAYMEHDTLKCFMYNVRYHVRGKIGRGSDDD